MAYNINNPTRAAAISLTSAAVTFTNDANAGRTHLLDRAAGVTVTLPAATGSGAVFRFWVKTSASGGSYIIQVANASDSMLGNIHYWPDSATNTPVWAASASDDTITLNGSTKGGYANDMITIEDIATNLFMVHGSVKQTGTEATPFSNAVS